MKSLVIFLVFFILPFGSFAQAPIKIGISAPLTGANATFGNNLKNVLIYANKKLTNNRYQLVIEDDHCDGKGAVTVAHKMVGVDGVAGRISWTP